MPSCPSPRSRGSPSHHHPLLQKQAAPSGTRAEHEALAKPGWQLEAPHAAGGGSSPRRVLLSCNPFLQPAQPACAPPADTASPEAPRVFFQLSQSCCQPGKPMDLAQQRARPHSSSPELLRATCTRDRRTELAASLKAHQKVDNPSLDLSALRNNLPRAARCCYPCCGHGNTWPFLGRLRCWSQELVVAEAGISEPGPSSLSTPSARKKTSRGLLL